MNVKLLKRISIAAGLAAAASFGWGAPVRGITVVPHDQWNGWTAFNAGPQTNLVQLRKVFNGFRMIDDFDMPSPTSNGLTDRSKSTIALAKLAISAKFDQVMIALMGQFAGAYSDSKTYYPIERVEKQYALWEEQLKDYPQVVYQFNDLGLVQRLTDEPTVSQANDPRWMARHMTQASWLPKEACKPIPVYARRIMAAVWKVNPKRKFIWQAMSQPLGLKDSRVIEGDNAYVPAAMTEVKGLRWPMTSKQRNAVLAQHHYQVPSYQALEYNDQGLYGYLSAHPTEIICEAGLPDYSPWESHLAWFKSMDKACTKLGRPWYLFRMAPLWTDTGLNMGRFAELQAAVAGNPR